jgi:hypothetical protein
MKKYVLTALALALSIGALPSVIAGPGKSFKKEVIIEEPTPLFRDFEFQIDGFYHQFFRKPGSANHLIETGAGGGFAFNYIFFRYFGLGVENFWTANGPAVYHLGGYGILRYPIESLRLAPYALVGGGAGLGGTSFGYFNVGGGLEFRITPNIGTFVDSRWYLGNPTNGSDIRAGVRLSF